MSDSYKRSLLKAVSWRLFSLTITMLVCFAVTESVHLAAAIGVVDTIIKLVAYFVHERAWEHINYERREDHGTNS